MFDKIDNDDGWLLGKSDQVKFGPDPAINGTNQAIIAKSAMNMKEKDDEATYAAVAAYNPKAWLNPDTERPVRKKVLHKLLKKRCHDDPNDPEDIGPMITEVPRRF